MKHNHVLELGWIEQMDVKQMQLALEKLKQILSDQPIREKEKIRVNAMKEIRSALAAGPDYSSIL